MSHAEAFRDGLVAAKAGKRILAKIQFEQAVEIDPDFAQGWLWLAWTAESPGQAVEQLRTASEKAPDDKLIQAALDVALSMVEYEYSDADATVAGSNEYPSVDFWESSEERVEQGGAQADIVGQPVDIEPEDPTPEETTSSFFASPTLSDTERESSELPAVDVDVDVDVDDAGNESDENLVGLESVAVPEESDTVDQADELEGAKGYWGSSEDPINDGSFVETEVDDCDQEKPDDPNDSVWNVGLPDVEPISWNSTGESATDTEEDEIEETPEADVAAELRSLSEEVRESQLSFSEVPNWQLPEPSSEIPPEEEGPAESEPAPNPPLEREVSGPQPSIVPTVFSTPAAVPSPQQRVVLTVDDSPTVRKLVTMTLEGGGYEVQTAENGVEAMKMLVNFTPGLILLDVNMPRMDGYKLCKLIKSHDKTKLIPVVMLSGKDGVFDKLRGKLVGCNDYISKPFESAELLRQVKKYIGEPSEACS